MPMSTSASLTALFGEPSAISIPNPFSAGAGEVTQWIVDGTTKAINAFFSDLVKSALNPLLTLLGRTLLGTPELSSLPRIGQLWENLLSVPELAALAHVPTDTAVAGLQQAGARAVPPPPGIPTPDRAGPRVNPLGTADTGTRRPVGLAVPDARHHLHLLGATGSGKSTLMAQLILADAHAGRGVVVIDPKGDLVTDLLDRLPAHAADRVVLFDADSHAQPPCLNPLHPATAHPPITVPATESANGDNRTGEPGEELGSVAVDNLTSVFARVYSAFWGPRTDDIFRAACLTLTAQSAIPTAKVTTLVDLPKLLVEPKYRARAIAHIKDPVLKGFWAWNEQLSDAGRAGRRAVGLRIRSTTSTVACSGSPHYLQVDRFAGRDVMGRSSNVRSPV